MSELKDFLNLDNTNQINNKIDGNTVFQFESNEEIDNYTNQIFSDKSNPDPFWDEMSKLLLKSLIYYTLSNYEKQDQNLNSCKELLETAIEKYSKERYLNNLFSELPIDHPVNAYYKSISIFPSKTYLSVLENLDEKLKVLIK